MHTGSRYFFALVLLLLPALAHSATMPFNYNFEAVGALRLTGIDASSKASGHTIIKSGNRLYIMDCRDQSRFYGVDVSDPAHPAQLFGLQLSSGYSRFFIVNSHAFFGGLVVDLTSPSPAAQASTVTGGIVAVQDNLLVSYKDHSVYFWDISNPDSPKALSSLANITYGSIKSWVFCGRKLLTDLAIIDVSNPPTFSKTGTADLYQEVHGTTGYRLYSRFSYSNDYLNDRKNGLIIDDLSVPKNPQRIAMFSFPDPTAFAVDGSLAFVTTNDGLYAIDIANPGSIDSIRGYYRLPSCIGDVAADGNLVYVFDSENHSVFVLRYMGERSVMAPTHDAQLAKAPASLTIAAEHATTISVTMRNTGSSSWGGSVDYKLAVVEDPGHLVSNGSTRINIKSGETVRPGENYSFIVPIRAPNQTGDYTIRFQMIQEFVTRFGPTVEVAVKVTSASNNTAKDWVLLE